MFNRPRRYIQSLFGNPVLSLSAGLRGRSDDCRQCPPGPLGPAFVSVVNSGPKWSLMPTRWLTSAQEGWDKRIHNTEVSYLTKTKLKEKKIGGQKYSSVVKHTAWHVQDPGLNLQYCKWKDQVSNTTLKTGSPFPIQEGKVSKQGDTMQGRRDQGQASSQSQVVKQEGCPKCKATLGRTASTGQSGLHKETRPLLMTTKTILHGI